MKVSDANQLAMEINRLIALHVNSRGRPDQEDIAMQVMMVQNALEACVTLGELRELLVNSTRGEK